MNDQRPAQLFLLDAHHGIIGWNFMKGKKIVPSSERDCASKRMFWKSTFMSFRRIVCYLHFPISVRICEQQASDDTEVFHAAYRVYNELKITENEWYPSDRITHIGIRKSHKSCPWNRRYERVGMFMIEYVYSMLKVWNFDSMPIHEWLN